METGQPSEHDHDCPCHRTDRDRYLALRTSKGFECIAFDQIAYVRGDGNSTEIFALSPDHKGIGSRIVYGKNLHEVEAKLPRCFARVNQSYIVPIRLVKVYSVNDGLQMAFDGAPSIYPTAHYCDKIAHLLPFWPLPKKDK